MMRLFFFVWLIAFPFLKGFALLVECTGGGEVVFNFILVDTTNMPRYRLERSFRASDENCVGAINIIGTHGADKTYALIEFGPKVFQELPQVDTLNLRINDFRSSNRDMYFGSKLQTINLAYNEFPKLNADIQFPVELRKLDFSEQTFLNEITLDFVSNHQSLTELDISSPTSVASFTFEEGTLQAALSLKKLRMSNLPVQKLKKSLLFNHTVSLKLVDMTRWKKLSSVEYNAFGGVSLEELNLSEWPFPSLDVELFSGASINKLNLQRSKIEILQAGSFAGLENSHEIDLSGSQIRSFESGSFGDFFPIENFKLTIPKDISCCNMEGIRELISVSNGISINKNQLNYTCLTPDDTEKVVDILSNEDPSLNTSCCNYQKEYYNSQLRSCELCRTQDHCMDLSDDCKGEETNFRTCNKCNNGYAVNPFECQVCLKHSDCVEASGQCSLAPGNEIYLKCITCAVGLFPDSISGICSECQELTPSCISYDSSCIKGTKSLSCKVCNDQTQLIEGRCVDVEDTSLSIGIIAGVAGGIVFIIALVSIIVVRTCLARRKKRKHKELLKSCGIVKNESNVELHPVEFLESSKEIEDINDPNYISISRLDDSKEIEYFDLLGKECQQNDNQHNDDDYVQLGVQQDVRLGVQEAKTEFDNEEYIQLGMQPSNGDTDEKNNHHEYDQCHIKKSVISQQPIGVQNESNLKIKNGSKEQGYTSVHIQDTMADPRREGSNEEVHLTDVIDVTQKELPLSEHEYEIPSGEINSVSSAHDGYLATHMLNVTSSSNQNLSPQDATIKEYNSVVIQDTQNTTTA